MKRSARLPHHLLAPLLALPLIAGCFNVFAPIDSPGGDPELLSAARAALDRGDFEDARKYYNDVSGSAADIKLSELAFTTLTQYNAGMAAFTSAFGTGSGADPGPALTSIANSIGTKAGSEARVAIFKAFKESLAISDQSLRGFVRFMTAIALLSETLAEGAADKSRLVAGDLAQDAVSCKAKADNGTCVAAGSPGTVECAGPANTKLLAGSATVDLETLTETTVADAANAPTIAFIVGAINEITQGLNELGSSGSLSSSLGGFTSAFTNAAYTNDAPCLRSQLLNKGIGTYK